MDNGTTDATILSGVETLVRLLRVRRELDERAGLNTATMVSGYPGSPLGGFDMALEQAAESLAPHRVLHRPGLNEELAAATVWGSQMGAVVPYEGVDGVVGAWYGKGPGLDRSGDAMKHANAMGAGPNGGVVMFCGDDPSSKSSTLATESQFTFQDACMPVLVPADQQDVLDLGVHAFWMSRYAGAWVGLKVVTAVADGIGTVDLDLSRHHPSDPVGVLIDGLPWRHEPLAKIGPHAVADQEALVVERRLAAAQAYARHNQLDRVTGAGPGAPLGIVCAGKTYIDVCQALTDLGCPVEQSTEVRVLKLGMTYPVVPETLTEFAGSVDQLLVIEEKRPFVETQVRSILHEAGSKVPVLGKRDATGRKLTTTVGELDAVLVARTLTAVRPGLAVRERPRPRVPLPLVAAASRAPGFCSGCPHNRSTVLPDGALAGGGVGCHGIVYFEERHKQTRSLPPTPMGAEGVPWIGLSPFVSEPHVFQNLGDGTLSHSGTLAIRASVAAGANVTFKILYNAAVAMTGGQDVTGLMDVPAMTRALEAEGVATIVVCAEEPKRYGRRARWARGVRVLHRDRLPEVQESLRDAPGVSVLIYDQRCAAEARRLRKRGLLPEPPQRVVINDGVCEGCGDCGTKSNCLSVLPLATEFGLKREIHDPSCNRDYTCLQGNCPSFVTITPKRGRSRAAKSSPVTPVLPAGELPQPTIPALTGRFGIYFSGIGGTGVVTAGRILARAAQAAGLVIGGVDQTGLSQKAGPVVSHLCLAPDRATLGAGTVGEGGADLYLSGDMLQAAAPRHLAMTAPGRTVAVVERDVTPTAAMLQSDAGQVDTAALTAAIADYVGADRALFVDAKHYAEAIFGDHLLGNVLLLGAAFQAGGIPLALADLEAALGGMGRSAGRNRAAFTWGRWAAHDPAAVAAAIDTAHDTATAKSVFDPSPRAQRVAAELVPRGGLPGDLSDELDALLRRRTAQAVDYQDARRGERFLDLVRRAAAHDDAEHGWELTKAVAEAWFKVLTYKDEYEVARLHLAADYGRMARDMGIDGRFSVTYQLQPPFLRRLGLHRKLPLGKPYELGFRVLRPLKRLRGTPFDPFGWDPHRRIERSLIVEYERLLDEAMTEPEARYDDLVRLAASVQSVRGYVEIKETGIEAWRAEVAELRAARAAAVGADA